ncbi:MAG: flagellar motor protein [Rhizonema sp. PD38]|nr:flagellar motor protein [Rhizonema sp. PD38]
MARRSRYTEYYEELNIWTAFTDLMSNAFMILLLILLIASTKYAISQISNTETPPILLIKDENYRFDPGSAGISPAMLNYITNKLVPDIEKTTKKFTINTVEIIGHTDEQPIGSVFSNLDKNLEAAASSQGSVSTLKAGSNADLGLMRSLAVVKELLTIQKQQGKIPKIKFRAYSAAQLILPNGEFAPIPQERQSEATRRRIEIRFTRLGKEQEVK